MTRTTIFLGKDLYKRLRSFAFAEHKGHAEVVREALERYLPETIVVTIKQTAKEKESKPLFRIKPQKDNQAEIKEPKRGGEVTTTKNLLH